MFAKVTKAEDDLILGLGEMFRKDPRSHKINLGIGIYQNEQGETPNFQAVTKAEQIIQEAQAPKFYLNSTGLLEFNNLMQKLVLGENSKAIAENRAITIQSLGGTGAVRLACEFIAQQKLAKTIWICDPTWPNHFDIFNGAGLEVKKYRYFNSQTNELDFDAMLTDLNQAKAGDVVLLHGCCHNPTGVDPSKDQWQIISNLLLEKNLLPLIDTAYLGLGENWEDDAYGLRLLSEKHPEMLICSSTSKNFGLYNERVGALTIIAQNTTQAVNSESQIRKIVRQMYSNPPAFGVKIVQTILSDDELKKSWQEELQTMCNRLKEMRILFVNELNKRNCPVDFNFLTKQKGMLSLSGLNRPQVDRLREEFAVYMIYSGRMNIAGISHSNIEHLCNAIMAVV